MSEAKFERTRAKLHRAKTKLKASLNAQWRRQFEWPHWRYMSFICHVLSVRSGFFTFISKEINEAKSKTNVFISDDCRC